VYAFAGRRFADHYLLVLLLGTFAAYALIPLVPVVSPQTAFPGADLPVAMTVPRAINVWMLDDLDNAVTVFPSGHSAVAFSSAFGLLAVFGRRPLIWMPAFLLAVLVYVATTYGRYHYFVDGLMSIAIAAFVWRALDRGNQLDS
jgi:membrane-associated phospholipid phosphatase